MQARAFHCGRTCSAGPSMSPFVIEGDTELPLQHFIRTNGDMPVDRVVTLVT